MNKMKTFLVMAVMVATLPVGAAIESAGEWPESAPICFESREWAADAMAGAQGNTSIAIEGGRLPSNATWGPEATHLVLNTVYVPSGITLTIATNCVVKFCPGTCIKVEDGGKLNIAGGDGGDVILTAANDATAGEAIAGFDAEQSIAFDGIRLQSSAASFTDNGWLETRGFDYGAFPGISVNATEAVRNGGMAYVPFTLSGSSRDKAFSVEWEAVAGTATYGDDYTLASGRITWNKSGDGTKTLAIPLNTANITGEERMFTVRIKAARCANVVRREATVKIVERDGLTLEWANEWVESAPPIRFESRDWAEPVMDGATNNASIAIEGGRLQSNATWNASVTHLVLNDVFVPSGVTLTITAGAVVKFCPGTTIKVEDGGKLVVNGADGNDVILTAANDATVGEAIAGFDAEQSIAFDGIRLQSSAASFTDNGWLETRGFTWGSYPSVSLNDAVAFRSAGEALLPVTVGGTARNQSFTVEWEAVDGTAKLGEDYTLASGRITWAKSGDGTKTLRIPLVADHLVGSNTEFKVRLTVSRGANIARGECTVTIKELDTLDLAWGEAESNPPIRFESREWMEPVLAGVEGNSAIAIEGGRLRSNTTWGPEVTHLVLNDVVVPSGVTLTITAGAIVKYGPGTTIKVKDGGKLVVNGADGSDVILTAANDATVGEAIAGFDAEQSIAFDGIRLQSSAATFTDNGWLQTRGFTYGPYPTLTIHDATANRKVGMIYLPVTVSGSRNQAFTVDWATEDETAQFGCDYTTSNAGRLTWSKTGDGTKYIAIPLAKDVVAGTNRTFKVKFVTARCCNVSRGEAVATIAEFENGGIESYDVVEWTPSEPSAEFPVNEGIKTQPMFLNDTETVQYSGKWQPYDENEAAVLRVTLETDNGATVLKETSPSETGAFDLDLKQYPVGYYTLKHEILNDLGETLATMQKTFSIADDEDVVLHGGVLTSNEVWATGKVHVVYETVVVPSIYTIFIEPGAIVKFMTGTGIDISQGGAFFANRIVFTHINDDTVGGDTLNDGFTVAPPMDAYFLSGAFTFGDDTELRGITQNNALTGTIATQKTLSRGSTYRVSGTLSIASGGSLTIPPGTVLKMEDKAAIVVNSGATLNAVGTRAAPITFTSIKDDTISGDTNGDGSNTIPQPGDWEEIKNNGGTMNLAFVTALYGGYGQYSNQGDAIIRTAGGTTTLDCCEVRHSDLRLLGRTGGTVYAENCVLEDGRWGVDGAATLVNCVIANCNTGANGATLKNSILWVCDTYASGGTASNCVAYGETTAVQVGMTYADPLFVDPANGDFRVKEGSPCVDAADGAVAPELDFYGQPRITITDHGDELVGQLADIGVCEVMPRDMVSDIDLVPQSVRTTTNAVPGQLLFVKWEIANVGGREVDAAWRDTVSLVSESGREVVLGVKMTSSRIGVGGSVFCSGYFTVPAISEGTWYPKVNVNSYHDIFEGSLAANNALTGERAVSVGLEALDPSIAREGVINGGTPTVLKLAYGEDAENRMVKFDVPAGVKATWGFGFMPGGTRSGASGSMTASGDGVMFRVPDGATDVYVVLESDTTTTYNLSTESTQMTITGVTPATLPSSGTTTLAITGAGFGETNAVSLMNSVGRVALNAPQKDASGNLIAMVDCAALTAGQTYAVRVESGENAAELPSAVAVMKTEGKGHFWARLVVPDSVRQGRKAICYVEYGNDGNADIMAQVLQVSVVGRDGAILKPKGRVGYIGNDSQYETVQFVAAGDTLSAGYLPSGYSRRISFYFVPGADDGESLALGTSLDKAQVGEYWKTSASYMNNIATATTRVGRMYGDGTDFAKVYEIACRISTNEVFSTISGVVFDEDGEALGNTGVTLWNSNVAYFAESDYNGMFVFDRVHSGLYSMKFSADISALNEEIEVEEGCDYTGLRLIARKKNGCKIIGNGFPDGSILYLTHVSSGISLISGFDELHTCNFTGLREGLYRVVVCEETEKLCEQFFVCDSDETPASIELSPHSFLTISGVVNGRANTKYCNVRLSGVGLEQIRRVEEDGTFAFGDLPKGYYALGLFYGDESSIEYEDGLVVFAETDVTTNLSLQIVGQSQLMGTMQSNTSAQGEMNPLMLRTVNSGSLWEKVKNAMAEIGDWFDPSNAYNIFSEYFWESWNIFLSYGAPRPPAGDYDCEHNRDKYTRDRRIRDEYEKALKEFQRNLIYVDGWKFAAESFWAVHKFSNLAWDAFWAKWSKGKASALQRAALDVANTLVRDRLDKLAEENQILSPEEVSSFKDAVDILSGAVDDVEKVTLATKTIKYITDKLNNKSYYSHFGDYSKFGKLVDGASTVVTLGNDLYETWQACRKFWDEKQRLDDAMDVMRDLAYRLGAWRGTYEAYAPRFNEYPLCCTSCPVPDPPYQPYDDKKTPNIPRSYDPNEMVGELGLGDPETQRFVKPGEWMTYTIYFENQTNATAAAQEVYVSQALNANLDWSTFEMSEVAFGDQIDLGLAGKKVGASDATMTGTNLIVRTSLMLDETTGQASWYLRIVDPTTDTGWPKDILAGFLPPNDPETHCGEGHITYRVKVRNDVSAGARIDSAATIVFDYNDPIETDPSWWNTVAQMQTLVVDREDVADVGSTNLNLVVGMPYGELPTPKARAGYTFGGWFTGPNGTGRCVTSQSLVEAGDNGLYALWLTHAYTVHFNANGGEGRMSDQAFEFDKPGALDANAFARRGYRFLGWATNETGAVVYADGAEVLNLTSEDGSAVDLFAAWQLVSMTVTFDPNDGTLGTAPTSAVVTNGFAYGALPTVVREGYSFAGWTNGRDIRSPTVLATTIVTNETDHVLYAQWTANGYTVIYDANGGEGEMEPLDGTYDLVSGLASNAFSRTSYRFLGWATSADGPVVYADGAEVSNLTAVAGGTVTLYAVWELLTVEMAFDAQGGSPVPTNRVYLAEIPYGELPEVSREGYTFGGWYTGPNGTGRRVTAQGVAEFGSDGTLYANWLTNAYTVRFNANGGEGVMSDQAFVFDKPDALDSNAFVRANHDFIGWSMLTDGESVYADGEVVENLASAEGAVIDLFAVWVRRIHTVDFYADETMARLVESLMVGEGLPVGVLPASPKPVEGYSFAGWRDMANPGTAVTTGTIVVGDMKVCAVYTANTYTLFFDAAGGAVSTASKSVVFDEEIGRLPHSTRDGYTFEGWYVGNVKLTPTMVYEIAGDATATAHWTVDSKPEPTPEPTPEPVVVPYLYEEVDGAAPAAAASVYDGYLVDASGNVAGTIQVKVGKPNAKTGLASVKATVVVGAAKASLKGADKGKVAIAADGPTTMRLVGGKSCVITLGAEGLSGSYGQYQIDGARNFFTSKDKGEQGAANGLLAKWIGAVNVAWRDEGAARSTIAPYQTLSVTIGKKGKSKATVLLADGTKATANAQLLVGEEWLCVPVVVTKKANLAFTLWLPRNGGAAVVEGLSGDAVVGKPGALKAGAKFHIDAEAFSARWGQRALPYLPDGVSVTQSGAKWTLPKAGKVVYQRGGTTVDAAKLGENPSALKLTYKAKDGSFKGSFKVYADNGGKLKATTVNVAGVVVNGVGYGTATVKKVGSVAIQIQ